MNEKPAKDPQIVTSSKRRVDEDRVYLDFEFKMGVITVSITAKVPEPGERTAPVGIGISNERHKGHHRFRSSMSIGEQSTLRITREAEYLIIPIDFGMLQLRAVARVTDEGEPDGVVYINFKLPPLGTSEVQTPDGQYPEAANG